MVIWPGLYSGSVRWKHEPQPAASLKIVCRSHRHCKGVFSTNKGVFTSFALSEQGWPSDPPSTGTIMTYDPCTILTTYEKVNGVVTNVHKSDRCPRLLWREYKRSRRLAKWDSLPCLRLLPHRALFKCDRCHFMNVIGPLCPWCVGPCVEIPAANTGTCQRSRRLSAPSLLNDAQKAQLDRIGQCRPSGRDGNERSGHQAIGSPSSADDNANRLMRPPKPDPLRPSRHRRNRRAAIHSATDVVTNATTDTELQPFLRQLANMCEANEETGSPPSPVLQEAVPSASTSMDPNVDSIRIKGLVIVDQGDSGRGDVVSSITTSTFSHRTLRRKQRMSILRKRSSRSLRKRSTPSLSTAPAKRAESTSHIESLPALPSPPLSPGHVPLGHPQRPLYTAIRKNMSPPTISGYPVQGLDSMRALRREREYKSLDIPRAATLGRSHGRMFVPASEWTLGYSLSGETELRMNLARCRSADSAAVDFKFVEPKRDGVVREKVKSLGKGLRGLLLGKP